MSSADQQVPGVADRVVTITGSVDSVREDVRMPQCERAVVVTMDSAAGCPRGRGVKRLLVQTW